MGLEDSRHTGVPGARRGASPPPKPIREGYKWPVRRRPLCSHQCPGARAAFLQPCRWRWASKGKRASSFLSGTYSSSYLCPLVVFSVRQLFFLPISVTDASGIFPGHIHLAVSSRRRLSQAAGNLPACAELYLKFVSLFSYFYMLSTPF